MPALLRLSQLARFWEKNPRTIHAWIRRGRLAAIRSPGGHFRVRIADVRAFCEREGMPLPPFAAPQVRRVVVAGAPLARAAARVAGVTVDAHEDPWAALLAVADGGAAALVLPAAAAAGFDVPAAVAALRRHPATRDIAVLVAGRTTRARARALERAGVTRVVASADASSALPAALRASLGLE